MEVAEDASRQAAEGAQTMELAASAAAEAARTLEANSVAFRDAVNRLAVLSAEIDAEIRDRARNAEIRRPAGSPHVEEWLEAAAAAEVAANETVKAIRQAEARLREVIAAAADIITHSRRAAAAAVAARDHANFAHDAGADVQRHMLKAHFPFRKFAKEVEERTIRAVHDAQVASDRTSEAADRAASLVVHVKDAASRVSTESQRVAVLTRQVCEGYHQTAPVPQLDPDRLRDLIMAADEADSRHLLHDAVGVSKEALNQCAGNVLAIVTAAFIDAKPASRDCYVRYTYLSLQDLYGEFQRDLVNTMAHTPVPAGAEGLEDLEWLEGMFGRVQRMHRTLNDHLTGTRAGFHTVLADEVEIALYLFRAFHDVVSQFAQFVRLHRDHLTAETRTRQASRDKLSGHLLEDIDDQISDLEDATRLTLRVTADVERYLEDTNEAAISLERYYEDTLRFERCIMQDGSRRRLDLPLWLTAESAELHSRLNELEESKEGDTRTATCEELAARVQQWERLVKDVSLFVVGIEDRVAAVMQLVEEHNREPPNDHNPMFMERSNEMMKAYGEELMSIRSIADEWGTRSESIGDYASNLGEYWRVKYSHGGRCPEPASSASWLADVHRRIS